MSIINCPLCKKSLKDASYKFYYPTNFNYECENKIKILDNYYNEFFLSKNLEGLHTWNMYILYKNCYYSCYYSEHNMNFIINVRNCDNFIIRVLSTYEKISINDNILLLCKNKILEYNLSSFI